MKKEITVGQLISVATTLLIAIITAWITLTKKVTVMEVKQQNMEASQIDERIENRRAMNELKWAIDNGNQRLTEILVQLQNKENRK
jgi:hypothetical protein